MTPDQSPRSTAPMTFDSLLDLAMPALVQYKKTFSHALDLGIRAKDIVLYACGALRPNDRERLQIQLLQSPWAVARVVALVKAKRDPTLVLLSLPEDDSAACEYLDAL